MATIPELFDSLKAYINSVIGDKITIINGKTVEASNSADAAADSASNAASSAQDSADSAASSANAAASAVEQRITQLVGQAPETLDTLEEFAAALGDDPNFSTTMFQKLGEKADTEDVDSALEGKADSGAENTAQWSQVSGKPSAYPTNVGQISAGGTPSSSTALYGDGMWRTPPDTTYPYMSASYYQAGTDMTNRTIRAVDLKGAIEYHAGKKSQTMTQAQYDALATKDPNVTYNIVDS